MADCFDMTADFSDVNKLLDACSDPDMKVHLARSMAVAGGKIISKEAKIRAPVYVPGIGRNGNRQGINRESAAKTGSLRDAIYIAYKDEDSDVNHIQYSVSWNSAKAPHGHLVEFGHWLVSHGKAKEKIKYVPAYPFLRPAYEASAARAVKAMIERGRERLPELLNEAKK